jgi:hypothetical protein
MDGGAAAGIKIKLVRGMFRGVIRRNKRAFEYTASIAKEVGAFAVRAFAGKETTLVVKTNGLDQGAQIRLTDLNTGKTVPVKRYAGIRCGHSISV